MSVSLAPTAQRELLLPSDWAWIDVVDFSVGGSGGDEQILAALLAHPRYDDGYMTAWTPEPQGLHGRYLLDAVRPETFLAVSVARARLILRAWSSSIDPAVATSPEFDGLLDDILPPAATAYLLPRLPEEAEHEFAWIVGENTGFHEFIVISPARDRVSIIVATDD